MNPSKRKTIVLASPFLITAINFLVAYVFGEIMGKWAFIPIILIEWCLFMFFVLRFGGVDSIKKWLKKPSGSFGWAILALAMGLISLPIFLMHWELLSPWEVWIPWILLALINPWIEEFYYRGLLLDYTSNWPNWVAILFAGSVFAINHSVFGVNSELNSGYTIVIATFVMGIIWGIVYKKTTSLRWLVLAHFLVDFFGLSAAAFLDLWEAGW